MSLQEEPAMRRHLILVALSLTSVGCTRYAGPIAVRHTGPADAPGYTIPQQETRGRERYTILEDDIRIGPKAYADRPSPTGR
jgi:hypothetical protein